MMHPEVADRLRKALEHPVQGAIMRAAIAAIKDPRPMWRESNQVSAMARALTELSRAYHEADGLPDDLKAILYPEGE